ncbi:MAG TPA: SIS domain-containing protein [Clostridiales bacterium]|nr:SIS domain-containing protein [Clostridiales bacterium]
MSKAMDYISNIERLIKEVKETQIQALEEAAKTISQCLISGGMIYTFGTGHSHMLAEEIFYRAGGLVRVNPILDEGLMLHAGAVKSTSLERLHGYAKALLDNYPVQKDDVIIIASNSGRNTVSIEMAIEAKKRGMKVWALTNLKHSKSVASRHESGKLLYELADIIIDNCGSIGDASMEFDRIGNVGPTSTVMGAMLLHAIICEAIEIMLGKNVVPEVFSSSNVDGGDRINKSLIDKYSKKIKSL